MPMQHELNDDTDNYFRHCIDFFVIYRHHEVDFRDMDCGDNHYDSLCDSDEHAQGQHLRAGLRDINFDDKPLFQCGRQLVDSGHQDSHEHIRQHHRLCRHRLG